jgi:glycosyltransferase involved in cell wall biosynthesis
MQTLNFHHPSANVTTYSVGSDVEPQPQVSILMPAYMVERYIGEAIDSVFKQTFTSYELIVINDGSPDQLEQVLAPYRERIVYLKQENGGQSAARNRGIEIARGRYLALLDPDDVWRPEYLSVQVAMMESDPTISVLYSDATLFGDPYNEGKSYMQVCPSQGEVTVQGLITEACHVMISALMRREVVACVGLFDEALRSSEDFDLWVRIASQGFRIVYHRQSLVYYRRRPESLSADDTAMCKSILMVLEKVRQLNLSAEERQAVGDRIIHYRALLRLYEGKRAFYRGDKKTALTKLYEANRFFKSPKLSLALLLLRVAPGLLLRAYQFRNRYLLKMAGAVRVKTTV